MIFNLIELVRFRTKIRSFRGDGNDVMNMNEKAYILFVASFNTLPAGGSFDRL